MSSHLTQSRLASLMVQGAPDNKQMPLSDTSGTAVRLLLRAERGHTVSGRGFLGNGGVLLQNIN